MQPSTQLNDLLLLMERLRTQCPWDQKQTRDSLAPYLLEESYEAVEAIQSADPHEIQDELGDVLFQVVFHAQLASEAGEFDMGAIIFGLMDKLIRRHPHVFTDQSHLTSEQVQAQWEQIKLSEKRAKTQRLKAKAKAQNQPYQHVEVPVFQLKTGSSLMQAQHVQKQAAAVGFDWANAKLAINKLREEIDELEEQIEARSALPAPSTKQEQLLQSRLIDEMGDVLFSSVNVARKLGLNAELTTLKANQKFTRRMNAVAEQLQSTGTSLESATLEQMQRAWELIKLSESKCSRA